MLASFFPALHHVASKIFLEERYAGESFADKASRRKQHREHDILRRKTNRQPTPEALNNDGKGRANIDAAQIIRLLPFWRDNPALWFAQVESAFVLHQITGNESKFRYIILNTDQSVLPFMADLIINPPPPERDRYQILKDRICSTLGETSTTRIRKLLGSHELGDQKPSIFL